MPLVIRHIGLGILLVALSLPLCAQQLPSSSLRSALFSPTWFPQDTTQLKGQSDTAQVRGTRSPALAIAFSAVLPGSGQIYAERYWTLPFIWGFGYWFVRQYRTADRLYVQWRTSYTASLQSGPPYGFTLDDMKRIRDFYRDERDRFAFYLAITYVLNIVDAYVGASLYGFDVGENLGGTQQLQLQFRIPLH